MRENVTTNAVAKNIFAEKTLEHADERLPLSVSDVVESAVRFGLGRDRLLDGVSCRSGIAFHRLFFGDAGTPGRIARDISTQPHFPLRIEMRSGLRSHPGSKSFIQPKIVPP